MRRSPLDPRDEGQPSEGGVFGASLRRYSGSDTLDADALAVALSAEPDPIRALRQYEAARCARANAVVVGSRRVGEVMQLEHPLACWLRDALLGARAAARLQMQQLERVAGGAT
jgi:2-polyprenyl-6-methoxyphenol hydroxylase-like FAD-dependent oxidoreductase